MTEKKSLIRIGLVQWKMTNFADVDSLLNRAEFFIKSLSGFETDFILFPELFNGPLMGNFNELNEYHAIRKLAEYTETIRKRFSELAVLFETNIITGSMPFSEGGQLFNVGFLCHRNGNTDMYRKIHITPNETEHWEISGGNEIRAFETDCGKIGILICYDVEFPELSRLLAEDGMQILFVPFLTDTQNGFTRVQRCAQARAIENECYVAIAGSVGELYNVKNMDIHYAQSAVFTPSDHSFPPDGIKAETIANNEMTLIADLDPELLKNLHNNGSVKNLKNRRKDVYSLFKTGLAGA
ncbi:MAG: carbon-nitrogen hydrolase family protein [Bacteroidia bacterium]|nr:carbon-nitrogen hydrolase family protein [Bacteroidia bacterium]